jgi:magnesium chelatase subunit I
VDKRSGVSQRLPIATIELAISNAERRALLHGETRVVPLIGDLYTALPGITGKLELEYEGEMKGADTVVRDIVRTAIGKVFDRYFGDVNTQQIEQWFNLGGTVKISDDQPAKATLEELKQIQGLTEKLAPLGVKPNDAAENVTAAAEFLLEGMCAHRRISRNEERSFSAQRKAQERPERVEKADPERDYEQWQTRRSRRGSFN